MWWSRRLVLAGALALAGCGFTPVYGPAGAGAHGKYALVVPETDLGYWVLERLEHSLGTPRSPKYVLNVSLEERESRRAVSRSRPTYLNTVSATARWQVTEGGVARAAGRTGTFASYSEGASIPTTEAARDDARARLARGLADRIVTELQIAAP